MGKRIYKKCRNCGHDIMHPKKYTKKYPIWIHRDEYIGIVCCLYPEPEVYY